MVPVMAKVRVLIVDDSRTVQLILAQLLGEDPEIVVVGTAGGAAEAERFFGESRIDAVTLDVEMPEVGGLQYLRRLRGRAVPVVMVSSRVGNGDPVRDEALRRGAAACFLKSDLFARAGQFRDLVKAAARRQLEPDGHAAATAATAHAA